MNSTDATNVPTAAHPAVGPQALRVPSYGLIWRWHFYAGLFCIPFVLWLSATGSLYLFKPQIDAWLDQPYDHLNLSGERAPPSAQVQAAISAVSGTVLNAYELPATQDSAVRILLGKGDQVLRAYLNPNTLEVLKVVDDRSRLTRQLFYLHGELMLGPRGSMLVELAASWTIVMILTGIYLWWPRNQVGLGGVLYPRLDLKGRLFWRSLHAVIGFWICAFTLFLLVSGLPWAKSWGSMLKEARQFGSAVVIRQDWTTGSDSEAAEHLAMNTQMSHRQGDHSNPEGKNGPVDSEGHTVNEAHAGHDGHDGHHGHRGGVALSAEQYAALDRVVASVTPLSMAYPVLISPPSQRFSTWNARSDAQNRPLREDVTLDAQGTVLKRQSFSQRPFLDRLVGYGVAIHEGQMFGWLNQAIGVFTALGLWTVSISGIVMWLKRKPEGRLGAPSPRQGPRPSAVLLTSIVALGLLLPLLGLSLVLVLFLDRWVFPRLPVVSSFLGLGNA